MVCREELRYNIDAVDLLIHNQLVILPQYDLQLAHSMENGMNGAALLFATKLIQRFCTDVEHLVVQLPEVEISMALMMIIVNFACCCDQMVMRR